MSAVDVLEAVQTILHRQLGANSVPEFDKACASMVELINASGPIAQKGITASADEFMRFAAALARARVGGAS